MAPRAKARRNYAEDDDVDLDDEEIDFEDEGDDSDFEAKKPSKKKKSTPAKKATPRKKKAEDDGAGPAPAAKKPKHKNPPPPKEPTLMPDGFTVHPSQLICKADPAAQGGTKIAALDLDGTLITRKRSDQAYYIIANSDDWRWYSTQVPEKLKELYETGHQLVIFSNQSSIKGAMLGASSEKIRTMVNKILADLNAKAGQTIPVQVLFATASDGEYRKPNTGMWRHFVEHMNAGVQPNLEESFFVGDAAGRDGDINNGADSDKQFAENIGLRFVLPEDMFGTAGESSVTGPNAALAAAFLELGKLMQQVHHDVMRSRAYNTVGDIIADWPTVITSSKDLKGTKGVGKSSVAKIDEFLQTGKITALEELQEMAGSKAPTAPLSKDAEMAFQFI